MSLLSELLAIKELLNQHQWQQANSKMWEIGDPFIMSKKTKDLTPEDLAAIQTEIETQITMLETQDANDSDIDNLKDLLEGLKNEFQIMANANKGIIREGTASDLRSLFFNGFTGNNSTPSDSCRTEERTLGH